MQSWPLVSSAGKTPAVLNDLTSGALLLDRGARAPRMNYSCEEASLPGWQYPVDEGQAEEDAAGEASTC